jgi:hypothetical protein
MVMKKQVTRRLTLTKDTIRLLEKDNLLHDKLKAVAGGHTPTRCTSGQICC